MVNSQTCTASWHACVVTCPALSLTILLCSGLGKTTMRCGVSRRSVSYGSQTTLSTMTLPSGPEHLLMGGAIFRLQDWVRSGRATTRVCGVLRRSASCGSRTIPSTRSSQPSAAASRSPSTSSRWGASLHIVLAAVFAWWCSLSLLPQHLERFIFQGDWPACQTRAQGTTATPPSRSDGLSCILSLLMARPPAAAAAAVKCAPRGSCVSGACAGRKLLHIVEGQCHD